MDLRLQLLETFTARGSDGSRYKVCAFDRLARDPSAGGEQWEPTGTIEYRLLDGRGLEVRRDGTARIARTDVTLSMPARAALAESRAQAH